MYHKVGLYFHLKMDLLYFFFLLSYKRMGVLKVLMVLVLGSVGRIDPNIDCIDTKSVSVSD